MGGAASAEALPRQPPGAAAACGDWFTPSASDSSYTSHASSSNAGSRPGTRSSQSAVHCTALLGWLLGVGMCSAVSAVATVLGGAGRGACGDRARLAAPDGRAAPVTISGAPEPAACPVGGDVAAVSTGGLSGASSVVSASRGSAAGGPAAPLRRRLLPPALLEQDRASASAPNLMRSGVGSGTTGRGDRLSSPPAAQHTCLTRGNENFLFPLPDIQLHKQQASRERAAARRFCRAT